MVAPHKPAINFVYPNVLIFRVIVHTCTCVNQFACILPQAQAAWICAGKKNGCIYTVKQ